MEQISTKDGNINRNSAILVAENTFQAIPGLAASVALEWPLSPLDQRFGGREREVGDGIDDGGLLPTENALHQRRRGKQGRNSCILPEEKNVPDANEVRSDSSNSKSVSRGSLPDYNSSLRRRREGGGQIASLIWRDVEMTRQ